MMKLFILGVIITANVINSQVTSIEEDLQSQWNLYKNEQGLSIDVFFFAFYLILHKHFGYAKIYVYNI